MFRKGVSFWWNAFFLYLCLRMASSPLVLRGDDRKTMNSKLTNSHNNMKRLFLILTIMGAATAAVAQEVRITSDLHDGWFFVQNDDDGNRNAVCDESGWQHVTVPHDWAISGPFGADLDKQTVAITQNGETKATEKTGRTGSLPWIGTGWYRRHFKTAKGMERVILNFDGAMAEPEVYVNGRKAGEWKYGYNCFNIDITPFINRPGKDNVVAVRLTNVAESSRWYPGAGLFRPVTLIQTNGTAIDEWGVRFETLAISGNKTTIRLGAGIVNANGKNLKARVTIVPDWNRTRAVTRTYEFTADIDADGTFSMDRELEGIQPWSPEEPNLYRMNVYLFEKGRKGKERLIDHISKKVGIRTVTISATDGFALNGVTRKIKGVCLHHDLGMIGAAVNKAALARQIKLLKTMGCDAIRTAHNMPSQMQMDLCDSLGMMVMAESFDMWEYPKCKNGYNRFFKEWWERDLTNLILANRLHPAIVMWSIGNEIPEQGDKKYVPMVNRMQQLIHSFDTTRPITTGLDRWDACAHSGFAAAIEVPGLNYRTHRYEFAHDYLPQKFVLGSETASTISSRGVYHFPVKFTSNEYNPDLQCSSYDLGACSWSNVPEEDWVLQDDNDWIIGEFVWTGFDYLGEPTPYDGATTARSSYFGIFDLAGLPKDRYYLYRSRWNSTSETIHLLPHWTLPGREGEVTPVYCYTNYPTAELFVNGKSQGRITKATPDAYKGSKELSIWKRPIPQIDRYRLRWNDVKYEPGELRVVVYDKDGKRAGEQTIRTAGKPYAITIAPEQLDEYQAPETLKADGRDMAFFTVSIVDKDGNICPDADNQIDISVTGAAQFKGICNGDATSYEVFTHPTMKTFHGQLVVGIISNGKKGTANISASSTGLAGAAYSIKVKE